MENDTVEKTLKNKAKKKIQNKILWKVDVLLSSDV